jgi:hypothetical protein
VEENKALDPLNISLLGPEAVEAHAKGSSNLV